MRMFAAVGCQIRQRLDKEDSAYITLHVAVQDVAVMQISQAFEQL